MKEKLNWGEKAALAIFGLILLAIIIEIVGGFPESPGPPAFCPEMITPIGVEELDSDANLLQLPGVVLTSSSHNDHTSTADMLIDGNPRSLWHVAMDRAGEPAWVTVDFGEGNARIVRTLAALPRGDLPQQFFRTARFSGSDDGETWETVAEIASWTRPQQARWTQWTFDNERAFQYYQLSIADGHETGRFYSMAGLALFE